MGKEKHLRRVEELFDKSPVVSVGSVRRIIRSSGIVKQYHLHLLKSLADRGKIRRLTKGWYTKHDDPGLIVYCFKNAYLGLQDALSHHGLWEQETIPVVITTDLVRPGLRTVFDSNVLVRKISKRYFFGFEYYGQDIVYPYSDIEKTFIDMIYYKERIDADVLKITLNRVDNQKLKKYLKVYPERIQKRVIAVSSSLYDIL